jgi:hypothetical protein
VSDSDGDSFAILPLAAYEALLKNCTQNEHGLVEKINKSIAQWRNEQHEATTDLLWEDIKTQLAEEVDEEDRYYFEPIEDME